MQEIKGGITSAKGFWAAHTAAEIKYKGRDDMALIVSKTPCVCAGMFTSNVVKAAPVKWDMEIVKKGKPVCAIVANSGIANACTGEYGMEICAMEAEFTADQLGVYADEVLVASTGVIGMQMDEEKLKAGIEKLAVDLKDTPEAGTGAEKAIMTTDTRPKEIAVKLEIGGCEVTIGGMCKGSGMIHPNLCTMLAFISTDANISAKLLDKALKEAAEDTFNMISVDGDTSTNDTLLVLANGLAGNKTIRSTGKEYDAFCEGLKYVCRYLAKQMAGDGEGATALFMCEVTGADTVKNARILAKSVICSSLTKAMIFGHDCNFGRVLCALGYSGVKFDPDNVTLSLKSAAGEIRIFENGAPLEYSEEEAGKILSEKEVSAIVDMHMGKASATAYGCDLSYDYVKINADYRS